MLRAVASNTLTLLIVVLIAAAAVIGWGKTRFEAPGPLTEAMCFDLERGAGLAAVSRKLQSLGAISDARIFRIGAEYSDKATDLRFGSYLIPPASSMVEILEIITRGGASTCGSEINLRIGVTGSEVIVRELDPATGRYSEQMRFATDEAAPSGYAALAQDAGLRLRVTLAEGVTSHQVVDALRTADFLTGDVAEIPAEGSLAPESYEVARGANRTELLADMAARQTGLVAELWANRAEGLPYRSAQEAVIMASIVEKETGQPEERPMVAGVFVNRLERGMPLQTDPTIIYGITRGDMSQRRPIRQSDKEGITERRLHGEIAYNTYIINGLPPTPIANPGRLSLLATLNPAETDAIYFVADGTGGHAFAATLREHNENVRKWRAIERERAAQGAN